ncbi:MAG: hypothetical protein ACP5VQ_05800 [Phycisphaerae bacterium]
MIPSANRRLAILLLIAVGLFIWWLFPHRTLVKPQQTSAATFSTGMDQDINGRILSSASTRLTSFGVPPAVESQAAAQALPLEQTFIVCRKTVSHISGPDALALQWISLLMISAVLHGYCFTGTPPALATCWSMR